jgi:hypothetical protein
MKSLAEKNSVAISIFRKMERDMTNFSLLLLSFLILLAPQKLQSFDFSGIAERLETEAIVSQIPMEEFLEKQGHTVQFMSPVYLVELESGIKAVLKLSEPDWPRNAIAEVAAYKASCLLDIPLVPPTVLYMKDGLVGSLQYYVKPSFDLMAEDNYQKALAKVSKEELANIALFYFVMGQWDSGPSNFIAVEEREDVHFALIDNAAMGFRQKARYGDYAFVNCFSEKKFPKDSDSVFPFEKARALPPVFEILEQEFGDVFNTEEIQRLCRLGMPIHFIVWQGKFWRQFRFGEPCYTDYYPPKTMQKLKELDLEKVQSLFENPFHFSFSEEFYQDLLERRDQVLQAFEKG